MSAAAGGEVKLGAGVDAIVSISGSKELKGQLSPVGNVVLWAGMRSFGQVAKGNLALGAGMAAGTVLAGTAYFAARALAEQTTAVATATVKELASGVGDLLPMFGGVFAMIITYGGSATGKGIGEISARCRSEFRAVTWGSGKHGEIMPCDLFMGAAVTDAEEATGAARDPVFIREHDGLEPFVPTGAKKPEIKGFAGGSLARLLRELEEEPPNNTAGKEARAAWPKAGIPKNVRRELRRLRLAMSAAYKNRLTGGAVTPEPTDGGATLWPLYADLLLAQRLAGRLPYDWLLWRAANHDARFARLSFLALKNPAAYKGIAGSLTPGQAAVNGHLAESDAGNTIPCALLDNRALMQFTKMLDGWWQFVQQVYVQFGEPGTAADNPLHGPIRPRQSKPLPKAVTYGGGLALALWILRRLIT